MHPRFFCIVFRLSNGRSACREIANQNSFWRFALGSREGPRHFINRFEFGQPLGRQPAAQRRLTPVGPRLRQRDLPADAARANEHCARPAAPGIQDLQPLAGQRVERMSDNDETRRTTG